MTLNKLMAARDRFISQYGTQPNAILLSMEHMQYLPSTRTILGMTVVECEQYNEPIAILMPVNHQTNKQ